tara:strand:- start:402 stop:776 length:375 start_codon:yes stop_codon:yes gene_type:complete
VRPCRDAILREEALRLLCSTRLAGEKGKPHREGVLSGLPEGVTERWSALLTVAGFAQRGAADEHCEKNRLAGATVEFELGVTRTEKGVTFTIVSGRAQAFPVSTWVDVVRSVGQLQACSACPSL